MNMQYLEFYLAIAVIFRNSLYRTVPSEAQSKLIFCYASQPAIHPLNNSASFGLSTLLNSIKPMTPKLHFMQVLYLHHIFVNDYPSACSHPLTLLTDLVKQGSSAASVHYYLTNTSTACRLAAALICQFLQQQRH